MRIVRRLRPEALEDLGLQSALAALRDQRSASSRGYGSSGGSKPPVMEEHELVVYRIAQEALANVARHAAATDVKLLPPAHRRARHPDRSR